MSCAIGTVCTNNGFFMCSTAESTTPKKKGHVLHAAHVIVRDCCAPTCLFSVWCVQKQVQLSSTQPFRVHRGANTCLLDLLLRRALTVQTVQKMRGFHSAVHGDAVDTPVVFQRQVPGLVQPMLKTMSLVCSSSTRCGRPCDYASQFAQRQVSQVGAMMGFLTQFASFFGLTREGLSPSGLRT